MSALFTNREAAGLALADTLDEEFSQRPPAGSLRVLGVARGGVPVACAVAKALACPLDVVVVRKVGAPGNPELGLGAVDAAGRGVIERDRCRMLGVDEADVGRRVDAARHEAATLEQELREGRPPADLRGCTAVVVDDGVATGGTLSASCRIAGQMGAAEVVAAAPVASANARDALRGAADRGVFTAVPARFRAVGEFYDDFRQVGSDEVRRLLAGEEA